MVLVLVLLISDKEGKMPVSPAQTQNKIKQNKLFITIMIIQTVFKRINACAVHNFSW